MRRHACATICWKHQLKHCADRHQADHSKQKEEEGQVCSLEQLEDHKVICYPLGGCLTT